MIELPRGEEKLQAKFSIQSVGHPESFVELMVPLSAEEEIIYSWTAEGEVDFNIHSHSENEVNFHKRFNGSELQGKFEGPERGHFYLMWQNRSTKPVEVQIQVSR